MPRAQPGDFNASGTGVRAIDVDDGHFTGLEGLDNSVSPSSYLHTLPDVDDDVTPLLSPHNAVPGGSSSGKFSDGVDCGITRARLHDDTQSDGDDDSPTDTIEELLAFLSQREDAGCVDDGVEREIMLFFRKNQMGWGGCQCRSVLVY